jgi:hypothetical protein
MIDISKLTNGIHVLKVSVKAYYNIADFNSNPPAFQSFNYYHTFSLVYFRVNNFDALTPNPSPSLSPVFTETPNPSPTIPEFPLTALIIAFLAITVLVGVLVGVFFRRK